MGRPRTVETKLSGLDKEISLADATREALGFSTNPTVRQLMDRFKEQVRVWMELCAEEPALIEALRAGIVELVDETLRGEGSPQLGALKGLFTGVARVLQDLKVELPRTPVPEKGPKRELSPFEDTLARAGVTIKPMYIQPILIYLAMAFSKEQSAVTWDDFYRAFNRDGVCVVPEELLAVDARKKQPRVRPFFNELVEGGLLTRRSEDGALCWAEKFTRHLSQSL